MIDPIEFYFDFSSPYSYFAAPKVESIGAEYRREVRWNAVMLGPAMAYSGNVPLINQPLKSDYCKNDWERLAKYQGMPWCLPKNFPIVTLASARGFCWINNHDPAIAKRFALECFNSYFGKGLDISDPEIIAPIAKTFGFMKQEFLAAIQTKNIKQQLKDKTALAMKKGMFGAPFFVIGEEQFWGADRFWMIRHWLKFGKWQEK